MEEYPLYLGLGSNIGDRKGNIIEALARLDKALGCHYDAVSDLVETDPWGFEADEKFMNAVVRYIMPVPRGTSEYVECVNFHADEVRKILRICKDIEKSMGRTENVEYGPDGKRMYHSRIIDIDILMAGDWRIDEPDLKIPHPLMQERDFVMIPLRQIMNRK